MNDFFKLGRSRPLTFEDCWELEDKNQASEKVTQLESFWLDELESEHPSLSRQGSSNLILKVSKNKIRSLATERSYVLIRRLF